MALAIFVNKIFSFQVEIDLEGIRNNEFGLGEKELQEVIKDVVSEAIRDMVLELNLKEDKSFPRFKRARELPDKVAPVGYDSMVRERQTHPPVLKPKAPPVKPRDIPSVSLIDSSCYMPEELDYYCTVKSSNNLLTQNASDVLTNSEEQLIVRNVKQIDREDSFEKVNYDVDYNLPTSRDKNHYNSWDQGYVPARFLEQVTAVAIARVEEMSLAEPKQAQSYALLISDKQEYVEEPTEYPLLDYIPYDSEYEEDEDIDDYLERSPSKMKTIPQKPSASILKKDEVFIPNESDKTIASKVAEAFSSKPLMSSQTKGVEALSQSSTPLGAMGLPHHPKSNFVSSACPPKLWTAVTSKVLCDPPYTPSITALVNSKAVGSVYSRYCLSRLKSHELKPFLLNPKMRKFLRSQLADDLHPFSSIPDISSVTRVVADCDKSILTRSSSVPVAPKFIELYEIADTSIQYNSPISKSVSNIDKLPIFNDTYFVRHSTHEYVNFHSQSLPTSRCSSPVEGIYDDETYFDDKIQNEYFNHKNKPRVSFKNLSDDNDDECISVITFLSDTDTDSSEKYHVVPIINENSKISQPAQSNEDIETEQSEFPKIAFNTVGSNHLDVDENNLLEISVDDFQEPLISHSLLSFQNEFSESNVPKVPALHDTASIESIGPQQLDEPVLIESNTQIVAETLIDDIQYSKQPNTTGNLNHFESSCNDSVLSEVYRTTLVTNICGNFSISPVLKNESSFVSNLYLESKSPIVEEIDLCSKSENERYSERPSFESEDNLLLNDISTCMPPLADIFGSLSQSIGTCSTPSDVELFSLKEFDLSSISMESLPPPPPMRNTSLKLNHSSFETNECNNLFADMSKPFTPSQSLPASPFHRSTSGNESQLSFVFLEELASTTDSENRVSIIDNSLSSSDTENGLIWCDNSPKTFGNQLEPAVELRNENHVPSIKNVSDKSKCLEPTETSSLMNRPGNEMQLAVDRREVDDYVSIDQNVPDKSRHLEPIKNDSILNVTDNQMEPVLPRKEDPVSILPNVQDNVKHSKIIRTSRAINIPDNQMLPAIEHREDHVIIPNVREKSKYPKRIRTCHGMNVPDNKMNPAVDRRKDSVSITQNVLEKSKDPKPLGTAHDMNVSKNNSKIGMENLPKSYKQDVRTTGIIPNVKNSRASLKLLPKRRKHKSLILSCSPLKLVKGVSKKLADCTRYHSASDFYEKEGSDSSKENIEFFEITASEPCHDITQLTFELSGISTPNNNRQEIIHSTENHSINLEMVNLSDSISCQSSTLDNSHQFISEETNGTGVLSPIGTSLENFSTLLTQTKPIIDDDTQNGFNEEFNASIHDIGSCNPSNLCETSKNNLNIVLNNGREIEDLDSLAREITLTPTVDLVHNISSESLLNLTDNLLSLSDKENFTHKSRELTPIKSYSSKESLVDFANDLMTTPTDCVLPLASGTSSVIKKLTNSAGGSPHESSCASSLLNLADDLITTISINNLQENDEIALDTSIKSILNEQSNTVHADLISNDKVTESEIYMPKRDDHSSLNPSMSFSSLEDFSSSLIDNEQLGQIIAENETVSVPTTTSEAIHTTDTELIEIGKISSRFDTVNSLSGISEVFHDDILIDRRRKSSLASISRYSSDIESLPNIELLDSSLEQGTVLRDHEQLGQIIAENETVSVPTTSEVIHTTDTELIEIGNISSRFDTVNSLSDITDDILTDLRCKSSLGGISGYSSDIESLPNIELLDSSLEQGAVLTDTTKLPEHAKNLLVSRNDTYRNPYLQKTKINLRDNASCKRKFPEYYPISENAMKTKLFKSSSAVVKSVVKKPFTELHVSQSVAFPDSYLSSSNEMINSSTSYGLKTMNGIPTNIFNLCMESSSPLRPRSEELTISFETTTDEEKNDEGSPLNEPMRVSNERNVSRHLNFGSVENKEFASTKPLQVKNDPFYETSVTPNIVGNGEVDETHILESQPEQISEYVLPKSYLPSETQVPYAPADTSNETNLSRSLKHSMIEDLFIKPTEILDVLKHTSEIIELPRPESGIQLHGKVDRETLHDSATTPPMEDDVRDIDNTSSHRNKSTNICTELSTENVVETGHTTKPDCETTTLKKTENIQANPEILSSGTKLNALSTTKSTSLTVLPTLCSFNLHRRVEQWVDSTRAWSPKEDVANPITTITKNATTNTPDDITSRLVSLKRSFEQVESSLGSIWSLSSIDGNLVRST